MATSTQVHIQMNPYHAFTETLYYKTYNVFYSPSWWNHIVQWSVNPSKICDQACVAQWRINRRFTARLAHAKDHSDYRHGIDVPRMTPFAFSWVIFLNCSMRCGLFAKTQCAFRTGWKNILLWLRLITVKKYGLAWRLSESMGYGDCFEAQKMVKNAARKPSNQSRFTKVIKCFYPVLIIPE